MKKPPKAAKNSFATKITLPDSLAQWLESEEGIKAINHAIESSLQESARFEEMLVMPKDLWDKPMSSF